MPNRHATDGSYRYGFQGQEKDDEIKGEGNSLNYTFRMHDPRVSRFFAVDPLFKSYPWNSPYAFSENRVIDSGELEGLERYYAADSKGRFALVGQVGDSEEIRILKTGGNSNNNLINQANNPELSQKQRQEASNKLLNSSFHGYNSTESAAKDWAVKNNDKSLKMDRELAAFIYKVKISNKRIEGKTDSSGYVAIIAQTLIGEPKDEFGYDLYLKKDYGMPGRLSAIIHAHSNGSTYFSRQDAITAKDYGVPIYLINKNFQLRFLDTKTMNYYSEGNSIKGKIIEFPSNPQPLQAPIYRWDEKTKKLSDKPDKPSARAEIETK